jgi:uncharacterized membrane protein YkoI
MKLITVIATTFTAAALSLGAMAGDVRPDEAAKLTAAGTILSVEKLNEAALALHPGGVIEDAELDKDFRRYVYEVEVVDANGVEWDIELDASNGTVLQNKQDD